MAHPVYRGKVRNLASIFIQPVALTLSDYETDQHIDPSSDECPVSFTDLVQFGHGPYNAEN